MGYREIFWKVRMTWYNDFFLTDFWPILTDFWPIFDWFLTDFWPIFDWFLTDFWLIFDRFLDIFWLLNFNSVIDLLRSMTLLNFFYFYIFYFGGVCGRRILGALFIIVFGGTILGVSSQSWQKTEFKKCRWKSWERFKGTTLVRDDWRGGFIFYFFYFYRGNWATLVHGGHVPWVGFWGGWWRNAKMSVCVFFTSYYRRARIGVFLGLEKGYKA